MNDDKTTISDIKKVVEKFREDRDWKQFHTPKDCAINLSIEAGEVLEHFRYKTDKEIREHLKDGEYKTEVANELADCMHAIAMIALECDIDLSKSFEKKIELTGKKYPIEKAKGNNKKYSQL